MEVGHNRNVSNICYRPGCKGLGGGFEPPENVNPSFKNPAFKCDAAYSRPPQQRGGGCECQVVGRFKPKIDPDGQSTAESSA